MKKIQFTTAFLLFLLAFYSTNAQTCPNNLYGVNPDAETGTTTGWQRGQGGTGLCTLDTTSQNPYSGNYSFQLTIQNPGTAIGHCRWQAATANDYALKQDSVYEFKAAVRRDSVPASNLRVFLQDRSSGVPPYPNVVIDNWTITDQWLEFSTLYWSDTNRAICKVFYFVGNDGTNTFYFDELCVRRLDTCFVPLPDFTFSDSANVVEFTNISDRGPDSSVWNFGDGTFAPGFSPTHTYPDTGTYTVCLTTYNNCGWDSICQDIYISCLAPPVAGFTRSVNNNTVTLTDTSLFNPSAWLWDFGDGTTDTVPNPVHSYSAAGTSAVCLTVTSDCGTDLICSNVTVTCPQPVATFSFTTTNLTADFTDLSTNQPTFWQWDFGDGATDTVQNPTHTYAANGTYQVCLTSGNLCGSEIVCDNVAVVNTSRSGVNLPEGIKVYPNPASTQLTIELTEAAVPTLFRLLDALGSEVWVYSRPAYASQEVLTVPLADFEAGVYLLQVQQETRVGMMRVVVVR